MPTAFAIVALVLCVVIGAAAGHWLALRSRGWRAAVPITAATAATCAYIVGYIASASVIRDAHASLAEFGLRAEVMGGYGSVESLFVSYSLLYLFPLGLVLGQLAAIIANRRARPRRAASV